MAAATATAVIAVIAVAVSAAAAGASMYMQSEAQAQAERDQSKAAKLQAQYARDAAEQEAQDREAAGRVRRAQIQERAQRMLAAQGSKAGAAGVTAFEGSLLENQLEAASLVEKDAQYAEYEEKVASNSARYRGELAGGLNDFQSRLFRARAGRTETYGYIGTGLTLATGAARTYSAYSGYNQPSTGYSSASLNAQGYGAGAM